MNPLSEKSKKPVFCLFTFPVHGSTKLEILIFHWSKKGSYLTSKELSTQAIPIILQDAKEIRGNPATYNDADQ